MKKNKCQEFTVHYKLNNVISLREPIDNAHYFAFSSFREEFIGFRLGDRDFVVIWTGYRIGENSKEVEIYTTKEKWLSTINYTRDWAIKNFTFWVNGYRYCYKYCYSLDIKDELKFMLSKDGKLFVNDQQIYFNENYKDCISIDHFSFDLYIKRSI